MNRIEDPVALAQVRWRLEEAPPPPPNGLVALTAVFVRDSDEEIAWPAGGEHFRMMLELIGAVAPNGEARAKVDFLAEREIVEHLREGARFLLIAGSRALAEVAITTVLWKRRPPHGFGPEEYERACIEEVDEAFEGTGFARRMVAERGLRYIGARLEGGYPETHLVLELEDLRQRRIEERAYDLYSSFWDAPFPGCREGPDWVAATIALAVEEPLSPPDEMLGEITHRPLPERPGS